jgi:hypothetical protein
VKEETIDTHSKALKIRSRSARYGTFRGDQRRAGGSALVFRVSGAARTIAKSMSAYDMKVSDAIYGHAERCISRGRLQAMLDREFDLRRGAAREGARRNASFFAFADTVVAQATAASNECHGWMGIKFRAASTIS